MDNNYQERECHWRDAHIPVLWLYPGLFALLSLLDIATDIYVICGFYHSGSSLLLALSSTSLLSFYIFAAYQYSYHVVCGAGSFLDRWLCMPVVLGATCLTGFTVGTALSFIFIDTFWLLAAIFNFFFLFVFCCKESILLNQTCGYAQPHMMFKRRMNEFVFESIPQLGVQVYAVLSGEDSNKRSLYFSIAASVISLLLNGYSIFRFKTYSKLTSCEVLAIAADTPRNLGIGHLMIDTYYKRFIIKDLHLDLFETEAVVAKYDFEHWPRESSQRGIDKLELNLNRQEMLSETPHASECLILYLKFLIQDRGLSVSKLYIDLMLYRHLSLDLFDTILEFVRLKGVSETLVKVYDSHSDLSIIQLNSATRDAAIAQLKSDQFLNGIRSVQMVFGSEKLGFVRDFHVCEAV